MPSMKDHPTHQRWTMKITANGQISLPAEVRKRWNEMEAASGRGDAVATVVVVDSSSGLLIRPFDPDAIRNLMGKYATPGQQTTDEGRREARLEEQEREDARDRARRIRT
jgi:bifunctional DNA-binding transcriptional regulator/antitoxin component of YhaV-PrlF toxin-antitoxin module